MIPCLVKLMMTGYGDESLQIIEDYEKKSVKPLTVALLSRIIAVFGQLTRGDFLFLLRIVIQSRMQTQGKMTRDL
jgi:hypothetical protein